MLSRGFQYFKLPLKIILLCCIESMTRMCSNIVTSLNSIFVHISSSTFNDATDQIVFRSRQHQHSFFIAHSPTLGIPDDYLIHKTEGKEAKCDGEKIQ